MEHYFEVVSCRPVTTSNNHRFCIDFMRFTIVLCLTANLPQVIRQVAHEANLCALLHHENIVEFLGDGCALAVVIAISFTLFLHRPPILPSLNRAVGVSVIPPSIALVYELCEGGSLDAFLVRHCARITVNQRLVVLVCL